MKTPERPMDPARWARLEALFHEATGLTDPEVERLLNERCSDDLDLKEQVRGLLAANATSGAVVDREVASYASPLLAHEGSRLEEHIPSGTRIGRYEVLEPLGTGGMGTVYRAERADGEYQQQVAVKLVRTGLFQQEARARFRGERDILARLTHPGIATLLDGGVSDTGQPYLVMELVEGQRISSWAETRGLDTQARIGLLIQVAEAVEYAHRNLVVHRDLKPSNIMVTDSGTVKLLDFGIARLLVENDDRDQRTRTGLLLLTPAYAAPEQIRGETVTTAVDVYAIGALMYELMTGRRPFGNVGSSWGELQRVLDAPLPPMSQVEGLDRTLRRTLEGDLDTIVLMAMHKDPSRRYGSAGKFAEDLRKYLDGRPVRARPDSALYRLSKLVQRNVAATITSLALVLAMGLGVAGTLWQGRLAAIEAERRQAVGTFMLSVFEGADPDLTPGEPVTALELLESGLARIDALEGGPDVRVDLLVVLGELFGKLGHYDRADTVLRQALEEAENTLSSRDPAIADVHDALGRHAATVGNVEEAVQLLRAALDARRSMGASPPAIAATRSSLAAALRQSGEYEEASVIYQEVIDEALLGGPGDSLDVATELLGLGQVRQFQARRDESVALFETVRRLKTSAGERDAQLAIAMHNLGVVLADLERNDEAESVHREALELRTDLFPDGHPEIARSLEAIGRVVERQGRWEEADSLYRAAIEAWSVLFGDAHSPIAAIRVNQANLRYFRGDFDAAAEAYRDGVRIWRAGGERDLLGSALRNLAIIDRERGDYTSADTLLAEALAIRRDLAGDRSSSVAEVYSSLAGLRNRQGRFVDAEVDARAAISLYEELLEPGHRLTMNAGLQLGQALVEQGRSDEAVALLQQINDGFIETLHEADAQRGRAALWLGISQAELGDPDAARRLIEGALPKLVTSLGSDAPEVTRARAELARLGG